MRMSNLKIVKDANIKELIEKPKEIKSSNWFNKNKLKKMYLLLAETNLVTKIKQVNSSILTLKTWLIILKIIQLVKQMLKKKFKCIKQNKKCRNKI